LPNRPSRSSECHRGGKPPVPRELDSTSESPVALVGRTDLLSWDSPWHALARGPPVSPLHRRDSRASTPAWCRHRASDSSCRLESRSVLVVSHHLDGFLRSGVRGLVASRCRSWGSPCFAYFDRHHHHRSSGWIDRHVPRRRVSYPPKDSPRLQPHRVTAAVAFLPFFPCRSCASFRSRCRARISSRSPRGSSTPRRCSTCESVTSSHRCQ
jgi:hypothetical protein